MVSLEKQNSFVCINSCQFGYQNTSEVQNCTRCYVIEAGLQFPVHIIKKQLNLAFQLIICLTKVCTRTSNI